MQLAVCARWQPWSALVVGTGHAYDSPAMPSCLLCRASRQVVQAGASMQAFLDSLAMFKVGKLLLLHLHFGVLVLHVPMRVCLDSTDIQG